MVAPLQSRHLWNWTFRSSSRSSVTSSSLTPSSSSCQRPLLSPQLLEIPRRKAIAAIGSSHLCLVSCLDTHLALHLFPFLSGMMSSKYTCQVALWQKLSSLSSAVSAHVPSPGFAATSCQSFSNLSTLIHELIVYICCERNPQKFGKASFFPVI